jgi:hypothetical protein
MKQKCIHFKLAASLFLLIFLFCFQSDRKICTAASSQTSRISKSQNVSVLLIGNSLVKRPGNNTISYLKNLAKKAGRSMYLDYVAYSNENLKNFSDVSTAHGRKAYRKIASRQWDYIILQENTDYAIAYGKDFLKACMTLASYIRTACPDAKIIYNCTWAYNKTVKIAGKKYTSSKQQKNMNANYRKVAAATGGIVCWTGNAFQQYRKLKGAKNLYLADKNHATSYGWFLNAACMYSLIFGTSPSESSYNGGLNCTQVKKLKNIAGKVNLT